MSFLIKDKGKTFKLDDCFDCPYIKGPLPAGQKGKIFFQCGKTGKLVTRYDKDAYGDERTKPFEELHDGKDFPAWCPIINTLATSKDKKERMYRQMYSHDGKSLTFKEGDEERDFIDMFE